MVLQNFLTDEEGVPKVMHFYDHEFQRREIRDPITGRLKKIWVLVFFVDLLNGEEVDTEWSITAERLAGNFQAFLPQKAYIGRLWTVTPRGQSFNREHTVESAPWGG
ncbi:hypothetical protein LCGC14_2810960 [marine sediment metagenome]|uniref:Uncharacterized protein n=1 Tax=marine sediment metagenome TaxID=412755 RepID=A0A0F9BB79_9ZZZZ